VGACGKERAQPFCRERDRVRPRYSGDVKSLGASAGGERRLQRCRI
jgi:hypothetical protein